MWTFDGYCLDLDRRELRRGETVVALEPQVFDLLTYLVRHRDRVVTKEEVLAAVWPGRIVSDSSVNTRINAVRAALGDDGKTQRLLKTVRGRGFRFLGQVQESAPRPFIGRANLPSCSISVRAFNALTGKAQDRAFGEGLSEEIIVALSRFQWLSVTGPENGKAATRYVLRGSVYGDGGDRRIVARLLEGSTGLHLWAGRVDGHVDEGLRLHSRAVETVVGAIVPALEAAERKLLDEGLVSPVALRLRAQPIHPLKGKTSLLESRRLLEKAVRIDPGFGAGWADLSFALQYLDLNGWAVDRQRNRQQAIDCARRALRLTHERESVATAAHTLAYFGVNVPNALRMIEEVTGFNSNAQKAWFSQGMVSLYAGSAEAAEGWFERSLRINPADRLGRRSVAGIGLARLFADRADEAISLLRTAIQEFPHWATPYGALASALLRLGFDEEAGAVAAQLRAIDPSTMPSVTQFSDERHREILMPGLKLISRTG